MCEKVGFSESAEMSSAENECGIVGCGKVECGKKSAEKSGAQTSLHASNNFFIIFLFKFWNP